MNREAQMASNNNPTLIDRIIEKYVHDLIEKARTDPIGMAEAKLASVDGYAVYIRVQREKL